MGYCDVTIEHYVITVGDCVVKKYAWRCNIRALLSYNGALQKKNRALYPQNSSLWCYIGYCDIIGIVMSQWHIWYLNGVLCCQNSALFCDVTVAHYDAKWSVWVPYFTVWWHNGAWDLKMPCCDGTEEHCDVPIKGCDVFGLCDVISSHCSIKAGCRYVIMFLGGVLWGLIQHYEQRRLVMAKFTLRC